MAKRCEKELYDIIIRTETACTNQEPEIDVNIPDADVRTKEVFSDMLVEAFTPIAQMDFEPPSEQNPISQSNIPTDMHDVNNDPETISADDEPFDAHINDCDDADDIEEELESDFSCDEYDEIDEEFKPPRRRNNSETSEPDLNTSPTEASKTRRGRPRTRPKKDPNDKRKIGRPRTRPETRKKREKKSYECKDCEKIFDKLTEFVVSHHCHHCQAR